VSQNYREGSLVQSGDLLFEVDPRPFQTALDEAGQVPSKRRPSEVQRRVGSRWNRRSANWSWTWDFEMRSSAIHWRRAWRADSSAARHPKGSEPLGPQAELAEGRDDAGGRSEVPPRHG